MHEIINEPIEVLVAFMKNRVMPLSFRWQRSKYSVDKVNFICSGRIGRNKLYYFSVMACENYYKLAFDTDKNRWFLAEINRLN